MREASHWDAALSLEGDCFTSMSGFDPRVGPVWRRSLRMQAAPASCCPCGDACACLGGHRSGRRHDPGGMAPVTMPPPVGSAYPPWGSQEGAPSGAHSPASLSCLTLAPVDSPDGSTSPPDGGASRASTSCRSRRHCLGGTQVRVYEGCKRATRGAGMHGARGDPARACGTAATLPSTARAACRAHAVVPWQAATADPEALHRSGTTPRRGPPGSRTWEEKRPNRFTFLVMRGPSASSLFASWPSSRHTWILVGNS